MENRREVDPWAWGDTNGAGQENGWSMMSAPTPQQSRPDMSRNIWAQGPTHHHPNQHQHPLIPSGKAGETEARKLENIHNNNDVENKEVAPPDNLLRMSSNDVTQFPFHQNVGYRPDQMNSQPTYQDPGGYQQLSRHLPNSHPNHHGLQTSHIQHQQPPSLPVQQLEHPNHHFQEHSLQQTRQNPPPLSQMQNQSQLQHQSHQRQLEHHQFPKLQNQSLEHPTQQLPKQPLSQLPNQQSLELQTHQVQDMSQQLSMEHQTHQFPKQPQLQNQHQQHLSSQLEHPTHQIPKQPLTQLQNQHQQHLSSQLEHPTHQLPKQPLAQMQNQHQHLSSQLEHPTHQLPKQPLSQVQNQHQHLSSQLEHPTHQLPKQPLSQVQNQHQHLSSQLEHPTHQLPKQPLSQLQNQHQQSQAHEISSQQLSLEHPTRQPLQHQTQQQLQSSFQVQHQSQQRPPFEQSLLPAQGIQQQLEQPTRQHQEPPLLPTYPNQQRPQSAQQLEQPPQMNSFIQQHQPNYFQGFNSLQSVPFPSDVDPNARQQTRKMSNSSGEFREGFQPSSSFNLPQHKRSESLPQNFPSEVPSESVNLMKPEAFSSSAFEHDQFQFQPRNPKQAFTISNSTARPMASSSPMVPHIPENQERPDNPPAETEDLNHQMNLLTIDTDKNALCSLDRNQYLETGHLSNENNDQSNVEILDEGDAPPPGLDRLVTGQVCEAQMMPPDQMQKEADMTRRSTPSSFLPEEPSRGQSGTEEEGSGGSQARRLVQGQSVGEDTDGREVPGEDDPTPSRVVLGHNERITPLNPPTPRNEEGNRRSGNLSDEYRPKFSRHRHRAESSYDEEDSERERGSELKTNNRRRRVNRSPEYRSEEDFDDRRPYHRRGRNDRRPREYNSPERDYRDYHYRDEHRRYKRYDHYNRDYDDDYYRENRSRPSSRTGSDYRRNIDYSIRGPPRSYYQDHPSAYGEFNKIYPYEYYEKMRQTDPVRYAAWYEQYMMRYSMQHSANYGADRASVHSGQSASMIRHHTPQIVPERTTRPSNDDYDVRLFATHHVKGKLDGQGRLVVIDPNDPVEGQRPTVNLFKMGQHISDADTEEFFESPGPFIPGVTHRNTVLQYLKKISAKAKKSSEKLLYDLIHLTVKGNGEVNEVDVAELLMNSYKNSERGERENADEPVVQLSEQEVIDKFRELLQLGNKTEALDWAIEHRAWGHALFLASKMDDRTHNQIMLRFANSIPHNDPLQTLYQLMSGHIPQSSTCCADKKWSDWRPHLAMILGNPTRDPTLDRKAIIRLGDSLNAHGRLFAAHFCYVTAQVEFTTYKPSAKLVLLGSSSTEQFHQFLTCRGIMLSMAYEYGLKLRQRSFNIPSLQVFKMHLVMKLIDNGRSKIALQYCEMMANEAVLSSKSESGFISDLIDVSSRLKMLDPTLALSGETDNDPEWLSKLKRYFDELPENHDANLKISHGISSSTISEVGQDVNQFQIDGHPVEANDNRIKSHTDPYASSYVSNDLTMSHLHQQLIPTQPVLPQHHQPPPQPPPIDVNVKDEQAYQPSFQINPQLQSNSYQDSPAVESGQENYWNSGNFNMPTNFAPPPTQEMSQTMANSKNFFASSEEHLKDVGDAKPSTKALNEVGPSSKKPEIKQQENKTPRNEDQRSGWFGGIWDKLSMRPKNQMRLPDDSNPSIVWDQEKKKWVNLDGEEEGSSAARPPPRAAEMSSRSANVMNPAASGPNAPPSMPQSGPSNYKLTKGKLMKSNYVDVMGGSKDKDGPSSLGSLPPALPSVPVQNNFFVPPPVEGNDNAPIDFITPTPMIPAQPESLSESNSKQQLSRCSSVSSLSREVQYYMSPTSARSVKHAAPQGSVPMMYNPRFQS